MALVLPETYYSGMQVCERNSTQRNEEIPFYVQVPLDYTDLSKGTTPLYAWTKKPFNPDKPTMIFIAGGPGDTAHSSRLSLETWNVVFFDQRGNSCSKPELRETYLSPEFYSSENTAKDVNEIRKHLQVDKISLYAVSYGTIPAHLYASFFADHTKALVFEGTVFNSENAFSEPQRRREQLQTFFESLPRTKQSRILELSNREDLPKNWFSTLGMMMLSLENGAQTYADFLDTIIWDESSARSTLSGFKFVDGEDTEFGFGDVMMGMIGCQELNMNAGEVSFYSVFKDGQLVSDPGKTLKRLYCQSLAFPEDLHNKTFKADEYSLSVPVTYLQGVYDGASVSTQATQHFKSAAKGFAQLLIATHGGHLPLQGKVASYSELESSTLLYRRFLENALEGTAIRTDLLNEVNQLPETNWVQITNEGVQEALETARQELSSQPVVNEEPLTSPVLSEPSEPPEASSSL